MTAQGVQADGSGSIMAPHQTAPTVPDRGPDDNRLEREIARLQHADHLCMIYEDADKQMKAAVPFIKQGLRKGEHCAYIVDDRSVEEVAAAFEQAGVDVSRERDRGAFAIFTKRDVYLRDGSFDPQDMIAFLGDSVEKALADGFTGYRVTGEMTWALSGDINCEGLVEYESLLNRFFPHHRALALCQYNRNRFPPAVIHDVLRTHPMAVLGDQVCPNLYYEPPELVLEGGDVAERVEWMIAQLRKWHHLNVSRDELRREVAERKRFEAELQQTTDALERSNKELEHFAYIASHDLQEPLRTISGYAQLLNKRYGDQLDKSAAHYIERTVAGTNRMQRLINDLLAYSRVQTHGDELGPVALDDIAAGALDDLERVIQERGARVQVEPLPEVLGDASQMHQVFTNLLTNAVKYCPEDRRPVIHVRAKEDPEHWHLLVEDNGTGIPADQHERIFVLFQRLVPRTPEDTGTGMGLAISRRILDRHRGRIWVESEQDKGSTFHFTIPKRGTPDEA